MSSSLIWGSLSYGLAPHLSKKLSKLPLCEKFINKECFSYLHHLQRESIDTGSFMFQKTISAWPSLLTVLLKTFSSLGNQFFYSIFCLLWSILFGSFAIFFFEKTSFYVHITLHSSWKFTWFVVIRHIRPLFELVCCHVELPSTNISARLE